VRALALSSAALHLVLCGIAGFLMYFVALFPWENQTPESAAADDWLIGAAAVTVALALLIGGAVVARRRPLASGAVVAQLLVTAVVVSYALGESDHSDGTLTLYVLGVAVTALAAVGATQPRQP
jgi:hypothetical protein